MARTYGVSALLAALPEECAMRRRRFPTRRANGAACNGKNIFAPRCMRVRTLPIRSIALPRWNRASVTPCNAIPSGGIEDAIRMRAPSRMPLSLPPQVMREGAVDPARRAADFSQDRRRTDTDFDEARLGCKRGWLRAPLGRPSSPPAAFP